MNVNEQILNEKIDPFLTVETLSAAGEIALGRAVSPLEARILTGGCWNRVISVRFDGDQPDLVFKINPQPGHQGIIREFQVLKYFSGTQLPVPEPYHLDSTGSIIPGTLLIMGKIPGVVMHHCYGALPSDDQRRISEEIAGHLAGLHRTRSTGFGGVELPEEGRYEEWADFWLPRFDAVYDDIASTDLISEAFLEQIGQARTDFRRFLEIGSTSTLTHYDVWSGNVMLDTADGLIHVSGFIDIPGHWADYARELSFAEMFGVADQPFYAGYTAEHNLDEGFGLRKSIYNLKMHLKHITMYPDQSYYRQGAQRCLETIQKAL